jgi:Protein phosphatase 2C
VSADPPSWQVLAKTVKAARKHVNQDCHGWQVFPDGTGIALAVADGHGSAAHPRSDTGAQLAVEAFLRTAAGLGVSLEPDLPLKQAKMRAEEYLPRNLAREWRERVEDDLAKNPVGEAERGLAATPVLYGTTLVGAMITGELVLGWQIGDGDLCLVTPEGQASTPLRRYLETLGDETDSLCSDDAQRLFHFYWGPASAFEPPALIVLSTDGLSKSFVSFDGYLDFVRGVYQRIIHDGQERVGGDMQGWLEQASSYSGDDTTLVAAWPDRGGAGPEGQSP